MSECVVMLCGAGELDKERLGYHRAFSRRMRVELIPPERGERWIEDVRRLEPILVISPDATPWLPPDIERLDVPTAVFHIDTFVATHRRVRSAALYDHVFVFHPGFADRFDHPGARLLPHAADPTMLADPEKPRTRDIGWVGHRGRSIYRDRDAILDALSPRFSMNDTTRRYSPEEMAALYASSRVVVNVSRDDWPADANMRCFEAMAAGALLVTRVPSELTDLGFEEGVHFAGYAANEDVPRVVEKYLRDPESRLAIARRGHDLVRRAHTYDARVETILSAVSSNTRAPARTWPDIDAWARRFEVHVEEGNVPASVSDLRRIARLSPARAAAASLKLPRLAAKVLRRSMQRPRDSQ